MNHFVMVTLPGAVVARRRSIVGVIIVGLVLTACSGTQRESSGESASDSAFASASSIESTYTELSGDSCKEEVDQTDPNATRHWICPGIAGYSLIVRRAEAGRRSIDVVDAAQRVFPLNFAESVTPHMSTLRTRAEWRVESAAGNQMPIALIVAVEARESTESPELVTHTYIAIVKITPNEVCVVEKAPESDRSEIAVRSSADSARSRPCASPLLPR